MVTLRSAEADSTVVATVAMLSARVPKASLPESLATVTVLVIVPGGVDESTFTTSTNTAPAPGASEVIVQLTSPDASVHPGAATNEVPAGMESLSIEVPGGVREKRTADEF